MSTRQRHGTGDPLFDEWLQFRLSSTSFAATQQHILQRGPSSTSMGPIDRAKSKEQVQNLLKLRREKLNDAKRNGDKIEVARLQNLNIFDEIEIGKGQGKRKTEAKCETPKGVAVKELRGNREGTRQSHSESLCGYLKLQQARGTSIPDEFSTCNLHHIPGTSEASFRTCDSPTRTSSVIGTELTSNRKVAARFASSVNLEDSTEPLSKNNISPRASSAIGPGVNVRTDAATKDCAVENQESKIDRRSKAEGGREFTPWSLRSLKDRQDPFLYEGLYKRQPHQRSRRSRPYPAKHDLMGCKIPMPHPKILAAIARIEYSESCSASRQLKCDKKTIRMPEKGGNLSMEVRAAKQRIEIAKQSVLVRNLRLDMLLVEMYTAEMARRCRSGIWWEGWIIVEQLDRSGLFSSTPYSQGETAATV